LSPGYEPTCWHISHHLSIALQAVDLLIDESSFTGETEPVKKLTDVQIHTSPRRRSQGKQKNVAFMGTLVRCGYGKVSLLLATPADEDLLRVDLVSYDLHENSIFSIYGLTNWKQYFVSMFVFTTNM